ncbi:MAG: hypothetical protein JWN54_3768 [Mycobacterium sp.]|nr:hypothetical protein [Mycobacterium sp.]
MSESGRLCPSGRCRAGSTLLGIMGPDGHLVYAPGRIPLTDEFVERAHALGPPESRFRFAEPCAGEACGNWTDTTCGVARAAASRPEATDHGSSSLPRCGIRHDCRWYAQEGEQACRVCPLVLRTAPRPHLTPDHEATPRT